MQTSHILVNFIRADLKRLRHYLPSILLSVTLLLFVCSLAGIYLSKHLYQENTFENINIAYYLPEDDDAYYNQLALEMLGSMSSMKEAVNLFAVNSMDEGYQMLDSGETLYLIIVPENFLSGVLDSTNPPLDIVVKDHSDIKSYIINELLLSYAKYLGIAQAGIYSALDTVRAAEFPIEQIREVQDGVNITYLNRALNKDDFLQIENVTAEGSYSLMQHYLASALMLTLFFLAVVIMPFLQKYPSGIRVRLDALSIHESHLILGRFLCCFLALYIGFLPCFIGIGIYQKTLHFSGLLQAVPAIAGIALILTLIALLCKNTFTANMVTLFVTLAIAYIGGAILPSALLPQIVQEMSPFLPGEYFINGLASALF